MATDQSLAKLLHLRTNISACSTEWFPPHQKTVAIVPAFAICCSWVKVSFRLRLSLFKIFKVRGLHVSSWTWLSRTYSDHDPPEILWRKLSPNDFQAYVWYFALKGGVTMWSWLVHFWRSLIRFHRSEFYNSSYRKSNLHHR